MQTTYARAIQIFVVVVAVAALVLWGLPALTREKPAKEGYGEPPGMIRAIHRDELGFRGWADMPGSYEGSSASSISAYMLRSA